jgi:inhibitor of the pro-sigma K processing machinery
MDFNTEIGVFLTYACGLLMICFFGKLLLWPVKWILKIVVNSILGLCILICLNAITEIWGVVIPVNFITAAITGMFGVPGVICMEIYYILM